MSKLSLKKIVITNLTKQEKMNALGGLIAATAIECSVGGGPNDCNTGETDACGPSYVYTCPVCGKVKLD